MAIELRSLPRFTFPSHSGGPQSRALTVGFPTAVRSAVAAINGFRIGFTSSDHELFQKEVVCFCAANQRRAGPRGYRYGSISRFVISPGFSTTRTRVS